MAAASWSDIIPTFASLMATLIIICSVLECTAALSYIGALALFSASLYNVHGHLKQRIHAIASFPFVYCTQTSRTPCSVLCSVAYHETIFYFNALAHSSPRFGT